MTERVQRAQAEVAKLRSELREAEQRLREFELEDSGVAGRIIKERNGRRFLVQHVTWSGGKPWKASGRIIRKDGSFGAYRGDAYVTNGVFPGLEPEESSHA